MIEPNSIRSAKFWEDARCFVAGEWEGELPVVPDGSVLFRTSGSTGEGKWVVLSKEALLFSAMVVSGWLGADSDSKWGLALPLNHVGGFGVVARAYSAGCGLAVYVGKWDAARFSKWVESEGVTHVSLVPTQVHDLLQGGFRAPKKLRVVVVGGGRLDDDTGQAARDAGWPVLASYGMTEACSQIATQSLDLLRMPYVECPLTILPTWRVRRSESGLLEIKGDALFSGTLEKQEEEWVFKPREPGWFTTNDRGSVDGDHLIPEGRADSVVKIMGELVDVEAVEKRFLKMAGDRVREGGFAVVAVEDKRRGHVLVAVFEKSISQAAGCFAEYQRLASGVERFERYVVVDVLPRTPLGKLKRGQLAQICRSPDS